MLPAKREGAPSPHPTPTGPQAPQGSPQGEQTGGRGSGRVPGEEGGVWARPLRVDPQDPLPGVAAPLASVLT